MKLARLSTMGPQAAPNPGLLRSLMAVAVLGAAGCDRDQTEAPPPPPMTGRANVVAAKDTASAPGPDGGRPALAASMDAGAALPKAPARQLCAGQSPRPAPKGALKTAAAADATPPPASIPFGVGKWVWMNLWAAWCGPCKEEMPRLVAWQEKLRSAGVLIDLAFVSMDDDERETRRFLEAQPPSGVRSTYWLPEGERPAWLGALGLKGSTQLPIHALVAPSGQVACVIEGAVEDRDYPAIAALVEASHDGAASGPKPRPPSEAKR